MNDAVLMNDANNVVCWYIGTIYIFLISFSTKVLCKKTSFVISELGLMPYKRETVLFGQLSNIIWGRLRYIHKGQYLLELK